MEKEIDIIMLPTEDSSHIQLRSYLKPFLFYFKRLVKGSTATRTYGRIAQHLYVTVSQDAEPIKKDDYILWENKVYKYKEFMKMKTPVYTDFYKIIATDDPELTTILDDDCSLCDNERKLVTSTTISRFKSCECIKPLPQVQQSFLKEFVANPDGEWEVEYDGMVKAFEPFTGIQEYRLKLNQDNTVNITPAKICVHPFKRLHWVGNNVFCNACKTTLTKNS